MRWFPLRPKALFRKSTFESRLQRLTIGRLPPQLSSAVLRDPVLAHLRPHCGGQPSPHPSIPQLPKTRVALTWHSGPHEVVLSPFPALRRISFHKLSRFLPPCTLSMSIPEAGTPILPLATLSCIANVGSAPILPLAEADSLSLPPSAPGSCPGPCDSLACLLCSCAVS